MTRKSFLMLAAATALSVVAAVTAQVFERTAPAIAAAGQKLFPGLETAAGRHRPRNVPRRRFRDGDRAQGRRLRRCGLGIPGRHRSAARDRSGALTLAEIAEAKTSDAARHADLRLADPGAGEGAGSEIVLASGSGDTIAHAIVGKRDATLGGITGGQYLRRGGEDETWLVRARILPSTRRAGWFDTRLFETGADDIVSASLTPKSDEAISFAREDGSFVLKRQLEDGKTARESRIARIPRLFATLDFDDVRALGDAAQSGPRLRAETADGIAITLAAVEQKDDDGRTWVRIAVDGSGDAADALRKRTRDFEFALTAGDAEILGWTLDDLVESAES